MNKITNLFKSLLVVAVLGIGSNAWGETKLFSEDFESAATPAAVGWTITGGTGTVETSSDASINKYAKFVPSSTSGNRGQSFGFSSSDITSAANCWKIEFDVAFKSGADRTESSVAVTGAKTADITTNNAASGDLYFLCKQSANGSQVYNVFIGNSTDAASASYTLTANTFYHFIITYDGTKVTAKIGSNDAISKVADAATIGALKGLKTCESRSAGIVSIDNIELYSLVAPAFTLSENVKGVSVGGTEIIDVTDITGSISSVSSNNTGCATASYDAGTITINGVSTGVATLTVTGTNDGLTLEKNIEVTVGAVSTTTVTVNYLCGETPIAEAVELTDVTVGSVLTASDIVYDDVISGSGCRYVNPVVSPSLPYTVEEDGVINITYTQQNAVSSLKVYASVNSSNYLIKTYDLDGKYVGDVVTIAYPEYYLLEGTLYSTISNAHGDGYYKWNHTLTGEDVVITYGTTAATNVVYYSEAEAISGASANTANNTDIRCSDATGATFSSQTDIVTLPAGIYSINTQVWGNTGVTFTFKAGDKTINEHATTGALNAKSATFLLTESTTITVSAAGANGKVLDLVYFVKTGEYYESMSIVGDFSPNAWEPASGIEMTRDAENPHVWTAVVKDFVVTSSKYNYEYKATANGTWGVYELGKDGDSSKNQTYNFDYDGARQGKYTLTFTVNTSTHTVSMVPTKQPTATVYFVNTGDWTTPTAWVWDSTNSNYNYTGGKWAGQSMSATGEQIDGKDLYEWSTYDITGAPNYVIFSDNGSNQTSDLAFVNGAIYNASGSTINVKTISAAGWATYCSPYALDFSGDIENLEAAYIVTGGADGVLEMTEVTGTVPAETGLLLKGEGAVAFPVASSDANVDVSANKLEGVTENTVIAAEAGYVLMASPSLGFYLNSNDFTVGANTAYLPADFDVTSARFFLLDGGKTTSISEQFLDEPSGKAERTVNSEKLVYDLQGRRVNSSLKPGLYIMSGKKVVIK